MAQFVTHIQPTLMEAAQGHMPHHHGHQVGIKHESHLPHVGHNLPSPPTQHNHHHGHHESSGHKETHHKHKHSHEKSASHHEVSVLIITPKKLNGYIQFENLGL